MKEIAISQSSRLCWTDSLESWISDCPDTGFQFPGNNLVIFHFNLGPERTLNEPWRAQALGAKSETEQFEEF